MLDYYLAIKIHNVLRNAGVSTESPTFVSMGGVFQANQSRMPPNLFCLFLLQLPLLKRSFYPSLRTSSPEKNQPGFLISAILESLFHCVSQTPFFFGSLVSNLSFPVFMVSEGRYLVSPIVKFCRPICIFLSTFCFSSPAPGFVSAADSRSRSFL